MGRGERPGRDVDRPIPLIDVAAETRMLRAELLQAFDRVLHSGAFLHGPDVSALEEEVARLCHARYAVACASGSDALLLALMALDVGPGDEVIVPAFTFFASASCIWRLGARPVFVDVDPRTFNLDVEGLERAVTRRTRAIIAVHLFGQCADMDAVQRLARRHGLAVVEDAAQAIGARIGDRPAGSLGQVGCFSFYPTKNLGGLGDGGMLTTSDPKLADRLRILASHGMSTRYIHQEVGINSRLDSLQAAALRVKLSHLPEWIQRRRGHARRYQQLFAQHGLDQWLEVPQEQPGYFHVWNQFTVRIPPAHRDPLRQYLAERGIGTETYYPLPLHLQPCFKSLGNQPGSLPVSELLAHEVLSLPVHPWLSERDQQRVVQTIHAYVQTRVKRAEPLPDRTRGARRRRSA